MWLTIGADWEGNADGTRICFYFMYWLFGILVYLDAYLSKTGWRLRALNFPHGRVVPCPLLGLVGEKGSLSGEA